MSLLQEKYAIGDVDLSCIRNRNEVRVIECLKETLEALGGPDISEKTLQDIYAYALNQLPARYVQTGSIVLRDPVYKRDIEAVISQAIEKVLKHPKE